MQYGLKYVNNSGKSVTFSTDNFRVIKFEGFGGLEADVQTNKAPFQDGNTFIDAVFEHRVLPLDFVIQANSWDELSDLRRHVSQVFNPKIEGSYIVTSGENIYEIRGTPESVPFFGQEGNNHTQTALVTVLAHNPYWRSLEMTEQPTFEALFQFPFEGEFEMGVQRDERIIDNDGDSPAPLFIEFNGPAINPQIINNTTGEYFKVNQTLGEGEVMEIDTEAATVFFVESDGTKRNVFNWIDDDAVFFKLALGENQIEYTADSDIQGAIVNIRYSKLYTAV